MQQNGAGADPRRPERICRYVSPQVSSASSTLETVVRLPAVVARNMHLWSKIAKLTISWQAVVAASAQGEDRKDAPSDDLTPGRIFFLRNQFDRKRFPDYMNVLGMIFSMCALMMRIKW